MLDPGGGRRGLEAAAAPKPSSHARRLVTISGASGTGKSALSETLRHPVLRAGGIFAVGKFPQQRRVLQHTSAEPYAAFAAACSDLCELVVSLSSSEASVITTPLDSGYHDHSVSSHDDGDFYFQFSLVEFRDRANERLSDNDAALLTRTIPGLLQLLRPGTLSSEAIGYREAQLQFQFAFRRFVRTITSFSPLVLVLDDLKWADAASMDLLEALLSDRDNPSLLILGCYRDDDLYSNLPHLRSLETMRQMAAQNPHIGLEVIEIGNLNTKQVKEFLMDLLSLPESEASALAECSHRKTLGYVFFVIQFLTLPHDSELLSFNVGSMRWTFDLSEIQLSTASTENVVHLVKNKMKSLLPSVVRVLPVMGCLGSSFSVALLDIVVQHVESIPKLLMEGMQAEPELSRPISSITGSTTRFRKLPRHCYTMIRSKRSNFALECSCMTIWSRPGWTSTCFVWPIS